MYGSYGSSSSGSLGNNRILSTDESKILRSESMPLVYPRSSEERWEMCDATYEFLRSVFCVGGLTICIIEATIVVQSRLSHFFPKLFPPKRYCDSAIALMREGKVHVIADIDGITGSHILRVMTGEASYTSGSFLANGVPVEAGVFRKAVGVISDVETPMPNLTVEENINFVVSMRTKVIGSSRDSLVEAACLLTELDRRKSAKSLSPSESFRLRLAMEIVRDPPIIIAFYPIDNLSSSGAAECSAILKKISTVLEKTVIISTTTLATHLFEITDTILLLGKGGSVIYSGESAVMPSYFNNLQDSLTSLNNNNNNIQVRREGSNDNYSIPFCEINSISTINSTSTTSNTTTTTKGREITTYDNERSGFSLHNSRGNIKFNTIVNLVLCGDDALDLAAIWAESEATSQFYFTRFYDSPIRRRVLQAITRYSTPPQDVNSVMPFTTTASPQYLLLKPIILWWYDALQTWRGPEGYVYFAFLSLGLLTVALLLQHQGDDQGGMYNIRGIQFVLFLLSIMANITSIGDVDHQLRLFCHQRNSGLYSTACFMIVFILRTILVRAFCLALFVPVVIFIMRMKASFLLLVGALSVTHMFLHVTVYALVPYKRWATVILWLYLIYCIIFSGFLLNLKSMPSFVGMISILRWGYGAALSDNLRNKPFSCDGMDNTSYCYTGNAYLEIEGLQNESTKISLTIFGIICSILIVILGIALSCRK